jgi:type IV fimbrial biogenesis protein FimT
MNRILTRTRRQPTHRRAQAGIALVETTVVTSVLAVLTGLAVPSFDSGMQRRHLEGAAAQLETDNHCARSLAVARNAPLRISFEAGAGGSCYVIHTGASNQCSCAADGTAICQGDAAAERAVRFEPGGSVSLISNSRSVLFDPTKGTSSPTPTVQLQARNGTAIHQVMNIMGRVRSCSPAPALSGDRRC